MQKNILVIGNGYDIAHGLETKYDDFINFIQRVEDDDSFIEDEADREFMHRCVKENGFLQFFLAYTNEVPGWVDLERLLATVVEYFRLFISNYQHFIDQHCNISWNSMDTDMGNITKMKTIHCLYMFDALYDRDDSRGYRYMKHLNPKYYTHEFGLNKREVLNMLKQQLDEIIALLRMYLEAHLNERRDCLKKIRQIEEIDPSYVISFNYTDTYKIYGIDPENVFHVHGSLAKDNMVLGFNDDNSGDLDFIYFKKYFQRIQKLTGYIDPDKIRERNSLGTYNYPVIYFYGHSMDKTDEDVIQKLRTMASGFVIYTYDQNDYEQKVINLIDVFGKNEAMEMIETKFIRFLQCKSGT